MSNNPLKKRKAPVPATFLDKLRTILNDEKYSSMIIWDNNGTIVNIIDRIAFTNGPMSELYQHSNYNSFVRQLNLYGFRKTQRKLKQNMYYHPMFNRDNPEQSSTILRKKRKMNTNVSTTLVSIRPKPFPTVTQSNTPNLSANSRNSSNQSMDSIVQPLPTLRPFRTLQMPAKANDRPAHLPSIRDILNRNLYS